MRCLFLIDIGSAPDAVQVADRWHLLKNSAEVLFRILQQYHPQIQQKLKEAVLAEATPVSPLTGTHLSSPSDEQDFETIELTAAQVRRQTRVEEAQQLYQTGWAVKVIASRLDVDRKTVRKYLKMPLPLAPIQRLHNDRFLDPYKPYILERWNAGCHNATQLLRELKQQGYAGQYTILREYVQQLRVASGLPPRSRRVDGQPVTVDPCLRPPTLRSLSWLVLRPSDKLSDHEQQMVTQVCQAHPHVATAVSLTQAFATMVRQRQADEFDAWLEQVSECEVPDLRRFALGLRQDYAAVHAALSLPWSNGPVEGHINRLKLLKRQMYGRAKLDLLRCRMLAA